MKTKNTFIYFILCTMLFTPRLWRGFGAEASAQNIGINATGATPNNSAMLDVVSTTKGMLIPRMTGTQKYAVATPATGLLIFQTDTIGFWYYNGTKWIPLLSSTTSTSASTGGWGLSGNGSTTASNFLGTTDNVSLRVMTNNTERMIVDSTGNIGIGITTPSGKLDVDGVGGLVVSGVNLDPAAGYSLTPLKNSGKMLMGWNRSAGEGEIDLFSNSQAGSIGGFKFYDYTNAGVLNHLVTIQGTTGYVGIGNPSPSTPLDVVGVAAVDYLRVDPQNSLTGCSCPNEGGEIQLVGDGANPSFQIDNYSGNARIHTLAAGKVFQVINTTTNGTYGTTGWTHSSDIRLKTNIYPIENALDKVTALRGVYFNWKKLPDSNKQMGFIAQEVEKIAPEVVVKDTAGMYSIAYGNLTALLVNAIKEQQKIIGSMQMANGNQQKKIDNQQLAIDNQQKAIEKLKQEKENSELRITKLEAAVQKLMQEINTEEVKK